MQLLRLLGLCLLGLPLAALADDVWIVNTIADGGPGSFRDVVGQLVRNNGAQTVRFELPPNSTITVRNPVPDVIFGPDIEFDGSASPGLRLDGNGMRILNFEEPLFPWNYPMPTVRITGIHFQNGYANGTGGCVNVPTKGTLFVRDSTFEGCSSKSFGGALYVKGDLSVLYSRFINNFQINGSTGAGLTVYGASAIVIGRSQFIGNTATSAIDHTPGGTPYCYVSGYGTALVVMGMEPGATGGSGGTLIHDSAFIGNRGYCQLDDMPLHTAAIDFYGKEDEPHPPGLTIHSSWFADNVGGHGAAIYARAADLTVTNSSFHNNTGYRFGAIALEDARLTLANVSFSGNAVELDHPDPPGADIHFANLQYGAVVTVADVRNVVFGRPRKGNNCNPAGIPSLAAEAVLTSTFSCFFYREADWEWFAGTYSPDDDFGLQPAWRRGWVPALHPAPDSVVIDSGTNAGCTGGDVRSVPRPQDGTGDGDAGCDFGAVEFDPDEIFPDSFEFVSAVLTPPE